MIISYAHNFIFLKTQKCAGTSVELALSEICGPDDVVTPVSAEDEAKRRGRGPQNIQIPQEFRPRYWRVRQLMGLRRSLVGTVYYNHMPATEVRRAMDPAVFDAYMKVTVVRNPWDREVSLYFWKYRNTKRRPPFEYFVQLPRYRPERKTFQLYSINDIIVADTILRYERLKADFSAFIASLGVDPAPELPSAKGNYRAEQSLGYRDYYSPRTREIVARRHAREIEAFGYDF